MCGNYESCLEANNKALEMDGNNTYAMGGQALALFRLGQKDEGIRIMRKAVEMTGGRDMNLIQDLRYMTDGKM